MLAVAIMAAVLAGCAVDAGMYGGYLTADECLNDRRCRQEWRAEKREVRRIVHRRQHIHTAEWERGRNRPVCMDVVTAVGEKAVSEENAEIFALRIWRSQVAFRYGESYTDFHRALHPRRHCSPVGIADTITGKIKEKWLGVTHWRCELSARPCKGRPEAVERD